MKIHCIGIGGIGLSGVAQILLSEGNEISGSDQSPSAITTHLQQKGIRYFSDHSEKNINDNTDRVIYSEAIPGSNPERVKAEELGIEIMNYSQALGEISKSYQTIAVAGTHGKTTVTGMLASILLEDKRDPTIIIGSKMKQLEGQNFRVGKSNLFLTEACEYRDNFLHLSPHILLITNLEPEHLDYFGSADNYYKSFQKIAEKIPAGGILIIHKSDLHKLDSKKINAEIITLSKDPSTFALQIPGYHNQMNAHAAAAVATALGIESSIIKKGLEKFTGTWRRFEFKGELNGAKLYDDYGHHPTEIKATLQAAREYYPKEKLTIIFQPHQYSRTRELFDDFVDSFSQADEVWITDIYEARDSDEDKSATSGEQLAEAISKKQSAQYVSQQKIADQINASAKKNDIFLVMGAGNIGEIFEQLQFD